jgi:hypothetical protein
MRMDLVLNVSFLAIGMIRFDSTVAKDNTIPLLICHWTWESVTVECLTDGESTRECLNRISSVFLCDNSSSGVTEEIITSTWNRWFGDSIISSTSRSGAIDTCVGAPDSDTQVNDYPLAMSTLPVMELQSDDTCHASKHIHLVRHSHNRQEVHWNAIENECELPILTRIESKNEGNEYGHLYLCIVVI